MELYSTNVPPNCLMKGVLVTVSSTTTITTTTISFSRASPWLASVLVRSGCFNTCTLA
ncbi:hypothetical protein E2C01_093636 [Portunus trituberculatus]|uniref:Uncharacterized protein n=1 Tax=Portunus trituberculatus TaxID=210409 RepID=A0A5B7K0Z7_PORTR|nr:hypothetical protein [Portunus trituberculatus]